MSIKFFFPDVPRRRPVSGKYLELGGFRKCLTDIPVHYVSLKESNYVLWIESVTFMIEMPLIKII